MSSRFSLRAAALSSALFLSLFAGTCSTDEEDEQDMDSDNDKCSTVMNISSYASNTAGVFTVTGNFPEDEDVFVIFSIGSGENRQVRGVPNAGRTQVTFSGLGSGSNLFEFYVSCDEESGQVKRGQRTIIVQ